MRAKTATALWTGTSYGLVLAGVLLSGYGFVLDVQAYIPVQDARDDHTAQCLESSLRSIPSCQYLARRAIPDADYSWPTYAMAMVYYAGALVAAWASRKSAAKEPEDEWERMVSMRVRGF